MKHTNVTALLAVLIVFLAGCIPGLGSLDPIAVSVATPHIAVATFTPQVPAIDVIASFAGGDIDVVTSEDPRFQCQKYRGGWDCYARGQDDPSAPRLVHEAGVPIVFRVFADDASAVVATAFWRRAP